MLQEARTPTAGFGASSQAEVVNADLIVAGCYDHARMRERAFGDVTHSLIRPPKTFVLLSC